MLIVLTDGTLGQDTPAEGFSLRKRASATHDSGECEGTGLAHILSRMVLAA
jgi:hypothetical protein